MAGNEPVDMVDSSQAVNLDSQGVPGENYSAGVEAAAHEKVKELLCEIREGRKPVDNPPPTESNTVLDQLNYKDLPNLQCA